jgi:hypothetical protein
MQSELYFVLILIVRFITHHRLAGSSEMGNDQSAPEDRNEAEREEVLFTIAYTLHGPEGDVYEENRKYTGRGI